MICGMRALGDGHPGQVLYGVCGIGGEPPCIVKARTFCVKLQLRESFAGGNYLAAGQSSLGKKKQATANAGEPVLGFFEKGACFVSGHVSRSALRRDRLFFHFGYERVDRVAAQVGLESLH